MDTRRENDHSHPHPETEDAGDPNPYEEAEIMTLKKPKGDACDKADERADEERVVDFMKHGREGSCEGEISIQIEAEKILTKIADGTALGLFSSDFLIFRMADLTTFVI